ncbi:hypothetical protein HYU90_00205 [Candidatus Collierbacteria bacterium]|jgi:hypothetical protein|nr:hypothetical protein [Candidatus Collierbacteria bacterium]
MKRDQVTVANALATTTAAIYIACRALVGLFPDLSFTIAQSWFHGIQLAKFSSRDLTMSSFFMGLITATIGAWLVGWCFAHCYNFYLKKK